ncbi:MAG: hypothetical protein SGPRY_000646, partial [Prymnesium sp.]
AVCAAEEDEQEADEPAEDEPVAASAGVKIKRRRADGQPKQSGLKNGQRKLGHSLLFKYRVAVECERLRDLMEKSYLGAVLAWLEASLATVSLPRRLQSAQLFIHCTCFFKNVSNSFCTFATNIFARQCQMITKLLGLSSELWQVFGLMHVL